MAGHALPKSLGGENSLSGKRKASSTIDRAGGTQVVGEVAEEWGAPIKERVVGLRRRRATTPEQYCPNISSCRLIGGQSCCQLHELAGRQPKAVVQFKLRETAGESSV